MADEHPFLLGRRENDQWVPVVALNCPEHGVHLVNETHEMFGSVWQCPEAGCAIRVFVEVDRERLQRIADDFNKQARR
jgi:hypothetical protein